MMKWCVYAFVHIGANTVRTIRQNSIITLSDTAITANEHHRRLCYVLPLNDAELNAALATYMNALHQLARTPALAITDIIEKTRALQTCVWKNSRFDPPIVSGDHGVAASLVKDILRHG